jgi:hypothetical protein
MPVKGLLHIPHRLHPQKLPLILKKSKVKVPCNRPKGPEGGRVIALLFPDLCTRRGGWLAPRPARFIPGKDPVPIVQEAEWAQGWSGHVQKILPPPGLDSQTIQLVSSHHTD